MNTTRLLVAPTIALLVLTGCDRAPEAPSAPAANTTEAVLTAAKTDGAIAAADVDLAYEIISGPTYDAAADSVSYQVKVTNHGKTTLASEGSMPVNLGVVIWDSNRSLEAPPANQDFMRVPLPQALAPGQEALIPITFQAAPTIGGIVVMDGVQENVSWFSSYGKPVLTLGQFNRCDGAEKTLCLADGTAVAPAR